MECKFSDLKITLLQPEGIKPGGEGNPFLKTPGDAWGAKISVTHRGGAVDIDFGVCAQLGETYLWAAISGISIPEHDVATPVIETVSSIWSHAGHPEGRLIGAQVCITPNGNLALLVSPYAPITTPKMDSHLADVGALLERMYPDVFETGYTTAEFSGISGVFN